MKTKPIQQFGAVCPCELSEFCSLKSDQEIIEYVRENKECYRFLIERYEDKISRYVKRISGVAPESVEDIVQDVFLKVYININSYDPEKSFSSWIYRIAHNETINFWRRNKRKNDLVISLENENALGNMSDHHNVANEVYGKINSGFVRGELDSLSERYRAAITMKYAEEASYKEISEKLAIPIGTVGTLINRGKKILRERLEQNGFSSEAFAS